MIKRGIISEKKVCSLHLSHTDAKMNKTRNWAHQSSPDGKWFAWASVITLPWVPEGFSRWCKLNSPATYLTSLKIQFSVTELITVRYTRSLCTFSGSNTIDKWAQVISMKSISQQRSILFKISPSTVPLILTEIVILEGHGSFQW